MRSRRRRSRTLLLIGAFDLAILQPAFVAGGSYQNAKRPALGVSPTNPPRCLMDAAALPIIEMHAVWARNVDHRNLLMHKMHGFCIIAVDFEYFSVVGASA